MQQKHGESKKKVFSSVGNNIELMASNLIWICNLTINIVSKVGDPSKKYVGEFRMRKMRGFESKVVVG